MENPLYRKIAKIISELKIQYHFVLQFILSKKGEIFVLECNARYGGASSISIKSGLKSFEWFLNNDKLKNQVFLPKKQITQVRHETNLFL
jgi:carbamoyl-phosphate synthase large subunit